MNELKTHIHSSGLSTEILAFTKASLRSNSIKSQILIELEEAAEKGLTPDEFVFKHGGLINTIRRRFTDLWKDGKIKHHPSLLTRKNIAGNDCVTWVLGRDMELSSQKTKRIWIGLTDEEYGFLHDAFYQKGQSFGWIVDQIETKLKSKNEKAL